jgi:hypothetical protein
VTTGERKSAALLIGSFSAAFNVTGLAPGEPRPAELGLTGSDAIDRVSQPGRPRQQRDREGEQPDPEAGQ